MSSRVQFIDHFKKLVEVNTPLICIRDFDIARVDYLIKESAGGATIVEWNPVGGRVDFINKRTVGGFKVNLPEYLKEVCMDEDYIGDRFIVLREIQHYLENPEVLFAIQLICQRYLYDSDFHTSLIVVCSSVKLPEEIEKYAAYLDIGVLGEQDEEEINEIINEHLIVNKYSESFPDADRKDLVFSLRGMNRFDIDRVLDVAMSSNGTLSVRKDKNKILEQKKAMIRKSGLVELVDAPEGLESIGGLGELTKYLKNKSKVFADISNATTYGVTTPKGVFIVGMPGCGKSLCAKATANIFKAPLIKLDMGSMMGKYQGESEENLRKAIKIAEAAAPCVLWIDEIEKAFSGVGGKEDSTITRMFGHFLTWMQDKRSSVYVVATANNASNLPPELKRKGRFDEIFCVNLPDEDERTKIFEVLVEKKSEKTCYPGKGKLDYRALAKATEGFNGADIESVISEAVEYQFLLGKSQNKDLQSRDKIPPLNNEILKQIAMKTISISKSCEKQIEEMESIFAESSFRDANTGELTKELMKKRRNLKEQKK